MNGFNKNNIFFSILLIVIFCFIVYLFSNESIEEFGINDFTYQKVYDGENLSIFSLNSNVDISNLEVNANQNNSFNFSFVPKTTISGALPSIGISSAYMSYNIRNDSGLLYSYDEIESNIVKSGATNFNIIRIPAECIGDRIHVNFKFKVLKLNITPATIYIGEKKNIYKHIISREFFELLFALFMFSIASMMLILGFLSFIFKLKTSRYVAVGLFTLFLSTYIFVKTETVFFFIKKPIFIYFMSFITASAFAASIAYLIYRQLKGKYKHIGAKLYILFVINITLQTILTVSGISEFIYFRELTFLLAFPGAAILLYLLLIKRDPNYPLKNETRSDKLLISCTVFMLLGLLISSVMYNISTTSPYIGPVYFTLTLYVMVQLFVSLDSYTKDYKMALRLSHFKEVALYDNLTKVGSRYAFDSDIKMFKQNITNYNSISITVIDLNNLKAINDILGHDNGDRTIADMGNILNCIETNFVDKKVKSYRVGGDEFLIIMLNTDYQSHLNLRDCIEQCYQLYLTEHPASLLQFSCGAAYSRINSMFNFDAFLKIVDQKMYHEKNSMKANNSNHLQMIKQRVNQNEKAY